ncbi:MAG: hypothetical protein LBQ83_00595 [Candidatus Margulisbacteria bacterium]|jgi:hypothetical protein|nr:hypothetical protein [Candidatus Margulisiibacteriota bacterium]
MAEKKDSKEVTVTGGNTSQEKDPRVCPKCGKIHDIRKDLGIKATREEVESLVLINNRVSVAEQAAQPVDVQPNVTKEQVQLFVSAALEAKAEALALQRKWWQEILAKYTELPKDENVFVDMDSGEFYISVPPGQAFNH